jgi:hypothetical protein
MSLNEILEARNLAPALGSARYLWQRVLNVATQATRTEGRCPFLRAQIDTDTLSGNELYVLTDDAAAELAYLHDIALPQTAECCSLRLVRTETISATCS